MSLNLIGNIRTLNCNIIVKNVPENIFVITIIKIKYIILTKHIKEIRKKKINLLNTLDCI